MNSTSEVAGGDEARSDSGEFTRFWPVWIKTDILSENSQLSKPLTLVNCTCDGHVQSSMRVLVKHEQHCSPSSEQASCGIPSLQGGRVRHNFFF